MIDAVLKGETGPARNAILLTAAVFLKAAGRSMTLAEGVDAACQSLESGAALRVLRKVREAVR
jgi:anthranilate phosphoribosyltransferase